MARNIEHELLTTPNSDVRARQRFVIQLKRKVEQLRRRASHSAASASARADDQGVVDQIYADDIYRAACTLKRTGQEMMWDTIDAALDPEIERINQRFAAYASSDHRLGSLSLDPDLDPGETWRRARVHLQPGGYHSPADENDLRAGAYYEEGGALYSRGQSVGTGESKAECAIRFIREWRPDFKPKRILDMACSAGASTIPYAVAFPEAEVHGIDLSAAMLRYAHAKAESVGASVHFHQMDVAGTALEAGSFDLVVSHNAMHEMSDDTRAAMFRESHRLLAPGGLCVHQDLPLRSADLDPVRKADVMFDYWFNGELHWADYLACDCEAYLDDAGFPASSRRCGPFEQLDKTMSWYFAAAQKPAAQEKQT